MLGDARLTLAESPDTYDLIVLDAFSSDAIPIHLMTREAMATYVSKLAPGGIVIMHVSNRHMELSSVVAGIAHVNGLTSRYNNRAPREGEEDSNYIFTSTVVISARNDEDFGALREDADWIAIDPPAGQRDMDRRLLQRHRRGDAAILEAASGLRGRRATLLHRPRRADASPPAEEKDASPPAEKK